MRKSGRESGFALLLVFALASIMAIMLYMALPIVTFEAERDKEALLIERGEQYSRAIQLYVRKSKRFPGKIEDLENTNGIRFLRHQYVDPMTGKSEWRIIHAGPGGTLLDSLITKKDKKEDKVVDNFITDLGPLAGAPTVDGNVNLALRKRPSDQAGAPGSANNTGPIPPDPGGSAQPAVTPAAPGLTAGTAPGLTPGTTAAGTNLPPQTPAGSSTGGGISVLPAFGSPAAPTAPATPQPGQLPANLAQQINNPTGQFPGGAGTPTDASRLIQGLLTTPRPGGLAGINGVPGTAQQAGQQAGQQIIGGGIAGVASTFKGSGIKIYNDQDEIPKWEFVYDLSKDKTMNPAAGLPPAAAAPGTPIGGNPATVGAPASAAPVPVAPPPQ